MTNNLRQSLRISLPKALQNILELKQGRKFKQKYKKKKQSEILTTLGIT